jgi:hypothetical protein
LFSCEEAAQEMRGFSLERSREMAIKLAQVTFVDITGPGSITCSDAEVGDIVLWIGGPSASSGNSFTASYAGSTWWEAIISVAGEIQKVVSNSSYTGQTLTAVLFREF